MRGNDAIAMINVHFTMVSDPLPNKKKELFATEMHSDIAAEDGAQSNVQLTFSAHDTIKQRGSAVVLSSRVWKWITTKNGSCDRYV